MGCGIVKTWRRRLVLGMVMKSLVAGACHPHTVEAAGSNPVGPAKEKRKEPEKVTSPAPVRLDPKKMIDRLNGHVNV